MKHLNTTTAARLRELLNYDPVTGEFTWRKSGSGRRADLRAGCKNGRGYIQIKLDGVIYYGHRLAWLYVHGEWPDGELDHRNGDKADNWISNLRPATNSQNIANACRPSTNTSGFKGVSYRKDRSHLPTPWVAHIKKDRKNIHLGYFSAPEEGHAAYATAANRLFGEYARAS